MEKLNYLKTIYDLLQNPKKESLDLSLNDVHNKGLFSLVISGKEHGKLLRIFIADKKINPFDVQLHTHRYPIKLTVLKGKVLHHLAFPTEILDLNSVELSKFEYKSPLNGGSGLKYINESKFIIKDYILPIGSSAFMDEKEYHTVSCSKDSIWIVEEGGFKVDKSYVLGVPFITENLYNEPKMFQVNDKVQQVSKVIKNILNNY